MFKYEGLNTIETTWEGERLTIVEPLFLLDISSIAACFERYGHSPLLYLLQRMNQRNVNPYTLLGNFAGTALDVIIRGARVRGCEGARYDIDTIGTMKTALRRNFREKALDFVCCQDFNSKTFKGEAKKQVENIQAIVNELFTQHDSEKALLEPSFVCPQLGIQGRVDLMTSDMQLLVEQKSGKNMAPKKHYVQVLLYFGVLATNFAQHAKDTDIEVLYSKFPLPTGLRQLVAENSHQLMREAIEMRNQIVAMLYTIARDGFESILPHFNTQELCYNAPNDRFFYTYELPQLERIIKPLQELHDEEKDYFCRMMTFVIREQITQKMTPATDKYTGLSITKKERSTELGGYDTITLNIPEDNDEREPDFRRGDMVYLFKYNVGKEPDTSQSILYKGALDELGTTEMVVRLNDGQQNENAFSTDEDQRWAVAHSTSDSNTSAAISALYRFICAEKDKRDLFLGRRTPTTDDYSLIVGPPGTGKTSQTLRQLVEEHPKEPLLLMAYTNRAVDEICAMLESAGKDYLRIGNESSCDPAYRGHMLSAAVERTQHIERLRDEIEHQNIVVSTTSTMAARPQLLAIKKFSLTIVDEASQILEPNIIGILSNNSIGRFILIGDYKQLPAVVQQSETDSAVSEESLRRIFLDNCRQSLFERLIRNEKALGRKDSTTVLRHQGRMHPDIADIATKLFYKEENLDVVPLPHQQESAPYARVLFINSRQEAKDCALLLKDIYEREQHDYDAQKTIGVIVTYRHQIITLRREIQRLGIPELNNISIDTVERYQGSQRDVIVFCTGVRNDEELDFLTSNTFTENGRRIDRKLNVAITRARKQFVLIGNGQLLMRNELYKSLILLIQQ